VVVERRLLDADRRGDVVHRGGVVAAFVEQPGRGGDDLVTPCGPLGRRFHGPLLNFTRDGLSEPRE